MTQPTQVSLEALIGLLGIEGAIAGLEKSDLTIADILELAGDVRVPNSAKLKRQELISAVISAVRERTTKPAEELMNMDADSLKQYFHEAKLTKAEILGVLGKLDIRPSAAARKSLIEFAAQEISDIGMFRRVAKADKG